jgi:protein TonB
MKIVSKPTPVYPPLAKASRVQGTVQLSVQIGPDGTVQDVQLISGHPLLAQAAIDAVKQWVYQPTLLNGNPVSVLTTVDVNFTLSQ